MKISRFDKFKSYFGGVVLEQSQSAYNPQLNIILDKGQVQLCTEDAIYSYGNKYYNFRNTFRQFDFQKLPGSEVLILGLGLGSVPYMLENIFEKQFEYTAVEIDEVIVELANKYLLSELKSYIEVFPFDASLFLQTDERMYDMIVMDIFQSAIIPSKFQTLEFLKQLKSRLSPNGIVLFNRLATSDEETEENERFFKHFQEVFDDPTYLEIRYNAVFLSDKSYLK